MERDFGNLGKENVFPLKDIFNDRLGLGKVVKYHGSSCAIFSGQLAVLLDLRVM